MRRIQIMSIRKQDIEESVWIEDGGTERKVERNV
jgi:hypothetical protein